MTELEKMRAVSAESNKIGEFIDWLGMQGMVIAEWQTKTLCQHETGPVIHGGLYPERKWQCRQGRYIGHEDSNKPGEIGGECERCGGTGEVDRIEPILIPRSGSIERLLAQYYGIDLDKVEEERQALLDELRAGTSS